MRTTYVSHGNTLLAPLVGLILCVPHFIEGTMLLGDVTQAAAAFVAVQGAFNWLLDNFPRLAECLSSVNRVGNLLMAFDRLEAAERPTASVAAGDRPGVAASRGGFGERSPLSGYPAELSITNSTNFAIFSRVRSPEFEM